MSIGHNKLPRHGSLKAVVTGGSGVLGRAIASRLLDNGWQVRILDIARPPAECVQAEFVQVDIEKDFTSIERVAELVSGFTHVFHLAARLPQAGLDEAGFLAANVEPTRKLALASADAGIQRFVYASSIEIYGAQPMHIPLDEDAELHFTGAYSRNKWECEELLRKIRLEKGLSVVMLRMPMIFGPGFYHERSILTTFKLLQHGLPIPLPAADAPVSFVSARDAAQAFELASLSVEADGESFNVAAPDIPTMMEHMWQVAIKVGSRSKPFAIPAWTTKAIEEFARKKAKKPGARLFGTPAELISFIGTGGAFSIEKARRILDYSPLDSCSDAWANTYKWYHATSAAPRK